MIKVLVPILTSITLCLFSNISLADNSHKDSQPKISDDIFVESNLNSKFTFDTNKPFDEYIKYFTNIVQKARVKQKGEDFNKVVKLNSPFMLNPTKSCRGKRSKGVLMIHGFKNSSGTMKDLGSLLQKNCLSVYSMTLPGHGTRPGDLLSVTYKEWEKAVDYGVKKLSKNVTDVYIAGFSMGGALATLYANEHKNIKGLILMSPAIDVDIPWYFSLHDAFVKIKKWRDKYKEDNIATYNSEALNGAIQTVLLVQKLQKSISKNPHGLENKKVFAAFSYEDSTINAPNSLKIMLSHLNKNKSYVIVFHSKKTAIPKSILKNKNVHSIISTNMDEKILDYSHMSPISSPKNDFYGKNKYRSCTHYKDEKLFKKCKKSDDVYFGEITEDNLKHYTVSRLLYNPVFENTSSSLISFFNF